jgi:hypothetical protein
MHPRIGPCADLHQISYLISILKLIYITIIIPSSNLFFHLTGATKLDLTLSHFDKSPLPQLPYYSTVVNQQEPLA